MTDDLYCKVYLKSDLGTSAIKTLIASITGGRIEGRTIEVDDVQFDVFENRPVGSPVSPDDFVRWPIYLEVEPNTDKVVGFESFVSVIASLLVNLRERGVRSVASCDFEEQLAAAMG